MLPKVKSVLDKVLEAFKTGNIPKLIAIRQFPVPNVPCYKWSFLNQLIVALNETSDARGFRQWQSVNRHVKKGAKSFDILVPLIKKAQNDNAEESIKLFGFRTQSVFSIESTDGEEVPSFEAELPELPLMDKARIWGISLKAVGGNDSFHGYFSPSKIEIGLASPDEQVFFHEMSHYADFKILGKLKGGQDPLQEIVAELSSLVLCQIIGKSADSTLGNAYEYIAGYAKKIKSTPYDSAIQVLKRVEKVLDLILAPVAPVS